MDKEYSLVTSIRKIYKLGGEIKSKVIHEIDSSKEVENINMEIPPGKL